MKRIDKWIDRLLVLGIVISIVMMVGYPVLANNLYEQEKDHFGSDCATLRSAIAEAYINIMSDPDYEYTGTDDQPMIVPEKYYTVKESLLGDGRLYTTIDRNNNVDAYFGLPERNLDYYMWGEYTERTVWLVRLVPLAEILFCGLSICFSVYRSRRKERKCNEPEEERTTTEKQKTKRISATSAAYGLMLLIFSLYLLANVILRLYAIPGSSAVNDLLSLMARLPFAVALAGILDAFITVRDLKTVGRPLTLLAGIMSVCLMLLVCGADFGYQDIPYYMSQALGVMIPLCWLIRGILLRKYCPSSREKQSDETLTQ